jgi:hypothetical protein
MTLDEALECAAAHAHADGWPDPVNAREIESGWYFPWRFPDDGVTRLGSNGLIVNKRTRKVVVLGSAYSLERDLNAHDAGYPLKGADFIVTAVADEDRAVALLGELGITKVAPEEEGGVIWRIPKSVSRAEIREKLGSLPADFGFLSVYFCVEGLEQAKREGCFSFEFRDRAE